VRRAQVSGTPRVEDEAEMVAMLEGTTEALAYIDQINEDAETCRPYPRPSLAFASKPLA
jgi:hypothetical protein